MLNSLLDIGLGSSGVKDFIYGPEIVNVSCESFKDNLTIESVRILSASTIEDSTFENCLNLKMLELPPIMEYTDRLFGNSKPVNLISIVFNEGTEKIGTLLSGLLLLSVVVIPESISSLDEHAIDGCNSINEFRVNGDFQLAADQFRYTPSISSLEFTLASPTVNNNKNLRIDSIQKLEEVTSYVDADDITLDKDVFSNCNATRIVLSSNDDLHKLHDIEAGSFEGCLKATYIYLEKSDLTAIKENTFKDCLLLTDLKLPDTVVDIQKNSFTSAYSGCLRNLPSSLTSIEDVGTDLFVQSIPSSLVRIGDHSFESATIGDNIIYLPYVSHIGESSFAGSNVKEVLSVGSSSLDENGHQRLIDIGDCALSGCNNLEKFDFSQIDIIGSEAFSGTSLTSTMFNPIVVSSSTHISRRSFSNIDNDIYMKVDRRAIFGNFDTGVFEESNLKNLEINVTYKEFNDKISARVDESLLPNVYDIESLISVYNILKDKFFKSKTDFYLTLDDLIYNKNGQEVDFDCLVYEDSGKRNLILCDTTKESYQDFISIPRIYSSTRKICNEVFSENEDLTGININNVEEVESKAFYKCSNIASISSNNLRVIGDEAFSQCESMTLFDFKNVTLIGSRSFSDCTSLTQVDFPELTSVNGNSPFSGCSNLESISFSKIETATNSIFSDIQSLKSVSLANVQSIELTTFEDDSNLTSIYTPNVLTIGKEAFINCQKLLIYDFGTKILSIGTKVFSGCNQLESIYFNKDIKTILCPGFLNDCKKISIFLNNSTMYDVYDELASNSYGAAVGTSYFTSDKNSLYPSLVVKTSSKVIKIANGLIVDPDTLKVVGSQSSYLDYDTTIDQEDLEELNGIQSQAFFGTKLKVLAVPDSWSSSIKSKIGSTPFNGTDFLILIVNRDYDLTKDRDLWSYLFALCEDDGGSPIVLFSDGRLVSDGNLIESVDPFIYDRNLNISGVNNDIVLSSTLNIPDYCIGIRPYAFKKSTSILHLILSEGRSKRFTIYDNAFEDNSTILSLDLQNFTNIQICQKAFYNSRLRSVTLPHVTNDISGYGLEDAIKLSYLKYNSGIQSIAPSAMIDYGPNLSTVIFPDTLTSIGEYAFAKVINLIPRICYTNISECQNLTNIGKFAFFNSIKSSPTGLISFPDSLTCVSESAFAYRSRNLGTHDISSLATRNVREIGPGAFRYNTFRKVDFLVNSPHLSSIGKYAFANSQYKYPIHIPSTIKSIDYGAFKNNIIKNPNNVLGNIISIDLPIDQVLSVIGLSGGEGREINEKFLGSNFLLLTPHTVISATNLGESGNYYKDFIYVTVDPDNTANRMLNVCPAGALIDIISKKFVHADVDAEEIYIPSYVDQFAPSCFMNCTLLRTLRDENEEDFVYFNSVEEALFMNCTSLLNVRLSSTATDVGKRGFYGCRSLVRLYEEENSDLKYYALSSIGDQAFYDCESLTSFAMSGNLKKIVGSSAFGECDSLLTINILMTDEKFRSLMAMQDGSNQCSSVGSTIKLKFGSVRSDNRCQILFTNSIYMNNGEVKLDHEFVRLRDIGDDRKAISGLCFSGDYDVKNQTYLNLSGISEVDKYVFDDITSLVNINFLSSSHASLSCIGDYSFYNCLNLETFSNNSPMSLVKIGEYAFGNCYNIDSMSLNIDIILSIGKSAFYMSGVKNLYLYTSRSIEEFNSVMSLFKDAIGFDSSSNGDRNPLELQDSCNVIVYFGDGGYRKLNYLLDDLSNIEIDINRYATTFIDKTVGSIKPLALIQSSDESLLPSIVANTFHVKIIGQWK